MKKFLLIALNTVLNNNTKTILKERELDLRIELAKIEADYKSRRLQNSYYKEESLTSVENELIRKRLELKNIDDSIKLAEAEAKNRVSQISTELQSQKTINLSLSNEITALRGIINELTKRLGGKLELVKA